MKLSSHPNRSPKWNNVLLLTLFMALSVSLAGCLAPGYNAREAMLFEDKMHSEFKLGSFAPMSDHFSNGTGIGLRMSYEYEYGMHFGFEYGTVSGVEGAAYSGPSSLTNPDAIREVGEGALSGADRRPFTINFDWDVPLSEDPGMPFLRYGFGVGGVFSELSLHPAFEAAVASGSPGSTVEVTDQLMFLFRPAASLRWNLFDGALGIVAEAQLDIAEHALIMDINTDGDKSENLDYGGFGAYVGLDYSF